MKIIFISGPMSGRPENNYPAFNAAAAQLRSLGYYVENPAENSPCESWTDYMRLSITQMMRCDCVALLSGWKDSEGAMIEMRLALNLNIPVRTLDAFSPYVESAASEI